MNIFLSYSHQDETWKERVATQLQALDGLNIKPWDDRQIKAGDDWLNAIRNALAQCDLALLLISADFLNSAFIQREEIPPLLQAAKERGVRVIPLIVSACDWEAKSALATLQARPKDGAPLERMPLPDAKAALAALVKEIRQLLDPSQQQFRPSPAAPRLDLNHLPAGAAHFLGREPELALLDTAWDSAGLTPIVELIAPGGTGKTALLKRWTEQLKQAGWRGARRVYAWSFYSQGSNDDRQASEDHFLTEALKWFGVSLAPSANPADKGKALAEELLRQRTLLLLDGVEPLQYPPGPLAGELRAPGLQTLLSHIASCASTATPGLILLSSREALTDLNEWVQDAHPPQGPVLRRDLGNLTENDGARLLHAEGARRAGAVEIAADDEELKAASREVQGHALTLSLLGRYLAKARQGDIRARQEIDFSRAAQKTGGHAFRVIAALERWLDSSPDSAAELAALRLLGFFDRPAPAASLAALRAAPAIADLTEALQNLDADDWQTALSHLADCRLLSHNPDSGSLDAHPLVREYFADRLEKTQPEAWLEGHRRIYEQLKADTPDYPDTLPSLQPLYQAVAHGCRAGLYQEACDEVYIDRILRGTGHDGAYSIKKLGAFGADLGAVACFFRQPWSQPAPELSEAAQAWLLNAAAFRLRALGRLAEALEPMRTGTEMALRQEDWKHVAVGYSNLSELQLSLGRIADAVADGERAVAYADQSGDAFHRMSKRTTLADARQQQGQHDAARQDFIAAEALQAQFQPKYPLLYSLQGFQYCELLLAPAERAAWRTLDERPNLDQRGRDEPVRPKSGVNEFAPTQALPQSLARSRAASPGTASTPSPGLGLTTASGLQVCAEVAQRAVQTLDWAQQGKLSLLTLALDHLTLARCALYADLLQAQPPSNAAQTHCTAATSGLRKAGAQHHLPRALLTLAWLQHALGQSDESRATLAEAERIAARGSMKLHLADLALTRARLFHDRAALTTARRLIEECNYGRRLEELADAEATLLPPAPHP